MQQNTIPNTLTQAAGLLSLGLLLQIAFTYPLWMYEEWRVFPVVPVLGNFPLSWLAFDYFNLALIIVALLGTMFAPTRRWWYLLFVVVITVLWLQDVTRFQYGIYIFSVLLALLYFQKEGRNAQLLQALQMGLIGVYFWAGTYQLLPLTTQVIFSELAEWLPMAEGVTPLVYLPGVLALLVASGLFFPATRPFAIGLAVVYHALQLVPSATAANQPVLWTYHLVTLCLVFLLFRTEKQPIFYQSYAYLKTFPVVPYAFIIFGTLPFFQFATPLHPVLRLQPPIAQLDSTTFFFHRQDRYCLPPAVDELVFTNSTDLVESKILHVYLQDWLTTEFGVGFATNIAQQRVLLEELCTCLDYKHQGGFTVVRSNGWTGQESVYEIRCK